MAKRARGVRRSLGERRELTKKINAYRKEHEVNAAEAIAALGLKNVSTKNYWGWDRALRAEQEAEPEVVESFPLALIPEREPKVYAKRKKVFEGVPKRSHAEDDKELVALMLEAAARLLRR